MSRRATAHPFATFTQPVDRSGVPSGKPVPVLIACADILSLIANGNRWLLSLLGPEWRRFDLPTSHWPMFSSPGPLAEILSQVDAPA